MPRQGELGVNDPQRVVDGFRGLPSGMDGSKDPILTPDGAVFYAQNVTFRGGSGPKTRPGFKFIQNAQGSGKFQGWAVHYPVIAGQFSVILYVRGGVIYEFNPHTLATTVISTSTTQLDANNPVYFCQASRFTIIQDGVSIPRIYNPSASGVNRLVAANSITIGNSSITDEQKRIPIGTHMAYGQGRLFVAKKEETTTPVSVWAGDIAFGGTTTSLEILESLYDPLTGRTKFTVKASHNFSVGAFVTIQNHSTQQSINSSYEIIVSDSATPKKTFEIIANGGMPANAKGSGGTVTLFNAGRDDDIVHFTEHYFLAEGGALTVIAELGKIRGLSFLPVQDTGAGQGDLVAFCERGATSFAVSLPRNEWKTTSGFQKILFLNIGTVSDSICPVNGDLYFRSLDGNGIRSYRNARAEFDGAGQTPISSEVDPILLRDTDFLLVKDKAIQSGALNILGLGVNLVYFDNRLLMTCLPEAVGTGTNSRVVFNGIIALDFKSSSGNFGKSSAVYDGVWTGLKTLALASGEFTGRRRAFAMCLHNNVDQIWEITKDDEFDSPNGGRANIVCSVTTKNFNFESPAELKKLIRADLWFDLISGGPISALDIVLYYRPDSSPEYIQWQTWNRCFTTEYTAGIPTIDLITPYAKGYAPQLRAPTPPNTANEITGAPDNLGYDFGLKVKWTGQGRLNRLLVHALKLVEKVSGG